MIDNRDWSEVGYSASPVESNGELVPRIAFKYAHDADTIAVALNFYRRYMAESLPTTDVSYIAELADYCQAENDRMESDETDTGEIRPWTGN